MNKDFLKQLKKLFKQKPRSRALFGTDPRADWEKMIITFAIINLLVIIWSGYLSWRINRGDIFKAPATTTAGTDTATRNKLQEILNTYNGREQKFEELRLAKPLTVDPGL